METDRHTTQWNKMNGDKKSEPALDPGFVYLRKIFENVKKRAGLVVRLPSLLHNGDTNEVSAQQYPTVFLLPGLDGFGKYSEEFSKKLNVQVLCIESDMWNVPDTMEEHAKQAAQEIDERLEPDQEFWLIGYSYGAFLALETTKQLEKGGRVGRVWLIDASFEIWDVEAAEKITRDVMDKVFGVDTIFIKELWPKTVEMSKEMFDDTVPPFELIKNIQTFLADERVRNLDAEWEDMFTFANALLKRAELMIKHKRMPRKSIKSSITLLRGSRSLSTSGQTLQQFLKQRLRVCLVEGDHFTVIKNKSASNFIDQDIAQLLRNQRKQNNNNCLKPNR